MNRQGAAIVGVGMTPVGVFPDRTSIGLAADALRSALADAGLRREAVDGLVWNLGRPSGEDYDTITEALGLRTRFVNQTWTHGRFTGTAVIVAALVVTAGLADVVACVGGLKRGGVSSPASWGTLPHGDLSRYGYGQFADEAAMALRRYLHLYGVDRERLADVVLAERAFALLNEQAYVRTPLTREDYRDAPPLVEPLRAPDCFPFDERGVPKNHAGVCVLVARSEVARGLRRAPVFVGAGQGLQAGREEVYFGRPGLGLFTQTTSDFRATPWDLSIYERAGIAPADVDGFYTYDAFSSLVWYALERFGHCQPGEAPAWATVERLSLGGSLPTNTNGGLLCEGHTAGWGQVVEMTRQLRHECGPRQIGDASILQWATVFGDAFLLSNDPDLVSTG